MSIPVTDLISQALVSLSDPNGKSNPRPSMLQYFNEVQWYIALRTGCLEVDDYFGVTADEPRYAYPEGRIQVTGMRICRVNPPTSLDDYGWLHERFSDEFRAASDGPRQHGYIYGYHARPGWFELFGTPTETIEDCAGILTYRTIPTKYTVETPAAAMELPDFMWGHVQKGMEIRARLAGRERAAARDDLTAWEKDTLDFMQQFTKPSDDRRESFRPPGWSNPFAGMH